MNRGRLALVGLFLILGPGLPIGRAGTTTLLQEAPPAIAPAAPAPALGGSENSEAAPAPTQTGAAFAPVLLALVAVPAVFIISWRRLYLPVAPHTPDEPPTGRVADWPALLLAGLVIWVAQAVGAASVFTLFSLDETARATLRGLALASLGGYLAAAVAAACVFAFLPGIATLIRANVIRRMSLRSVARPFLAFALVFPVVMTIGWLSAAAVRWVSGDAPEAVAHETLRLLADPAAVQGDQRGWWLVVTLSVVIGAPAVEELVYRGFIQSAIRRGVLWQPASAPMRIVSLSDRRRAATIAILITSGIFTLMHAGVAEPHALATLFALSLCFGVAYERTARLGTTILMHALFNVANLTLALL